MVCLVSSEITEKILTSIQNITHMVPTGTGKPGKNGKALSGQAILPKILEKSEKIILEK